MNLLMSPGWIREQSAGMSWINPGSGDNISMLTRYFLPIVRVHNIIVR
jgi:hypothetical protein